MTVPPQALGDNARNQLKAFAERISGLEKESADLKAQGKSVKEQIKEEYQKARSTGFSPQILKQAIKELLLEPDDRLLQLEMDFRQRLEMDNYREVLDLPTAQEVEANHARDRLRSKAA